MEQTLESVLFYLNLQRQRAPVHRYSLSFALRDPLHSKVFSITKLHITSNQFLGFRKRSMVSIHRNGWKLTVHNMTAKTLTRLIIERTITELPHPIILDICPERNRFFFLSLGAIVLKFWY